MYALVALFASAFLSSSAALALLFALRRRDGSELALAAIRIELCILVVLVANAVGAFRETFGAESDLVLEFALMGVVAIAIERYSRQVIAVAALALGGRLARRPAMAYDIAAAALYVAVVFASIVLPSASGTLGFKNEDGFALSSYFGAAAAIVAGVAVIARRARLDDRARGTALIAAATVLVIAALSCANEAFELAGVLGLAQLPISPILMIAQNLIVIVAASRALAHPAADAKGVTKATGIADAAGLAGGDALAATATGCAPRVIPEGDPGLDEATARLADSSGLSEREREVLRLVLAGADNAFIGERLFISPFTVKNHVHNVFRKTGAASRLELLRLAGSPSLKSP